MCMGVPWPGFGSLWEGPHPGEKEECEESSPWEEEAAETKFHGLSTAPIPCPLCCWEGEVEKNGRKVEPTKKGRVREGFH